MDMTVFAYIGIAVVGTVGTVQVLKGFLPKAPTWIWRTIVALACVGWGIAIGQVWLTRALYASLLIALSYAGYEVIVKKLGEVAGRIVDKLG